MALVQRTADILLLGICQPKVEPMVLTLGCVHLKSDEVTVQWAKRLDRVEEGVGVGLALGGPHVFRNLEAATSEAHALRIVSVHADTPPNKTGSDTHMGYPHPGAVLAWAFGTLLLAYSLWMLWRPES